VRVRADEQTAARSQPHRVLAKGWRRVRWHLYWLYPIYMQLKGNVPPSPLGFNPRRKSKGSLPAGLRNSNRTTLRHGSTLYATIAAMWGYQPEPDPARKQGTIVAWQGMGAGRIQADNGDPVDLFYWSILHGFRQLTVGQRVEFLREPLGANRHMATLVVPADSH